MKAPRGFNEHDRNGGWQSPVPLAPAAVPTFPIETLAPWLRAYVMSTAMALQVPVDVVAMTSLAVIATAVMGKVEVKVRPGYIEPVQIFVAIVMPSGEGKTPAINAMKAPILAYERDTTARQAPMIAEADRNRRILQRALRRAEHVAADPKNLLDPTALGDVTKIEAKLKELKDRVPPRLLAQDVTPEALAELMDRHGGRMAIISDEPGPFEILQGRYAGALGASLDIFLQGHSGSELRVDRKNGPQICIPKPSLTMALGIQPHALGRVMADERMRDRGLLPRVFFVVPISNIGDRLADPALTAGWTRNEYSNKVTQLLHLAPVAPQTLELTAEAGAKWTEFKAEIESQLRPGGNLTAIMAWAHKLAGGVARFAGLLHCALHVPDDPWSVHISVDTMLHSIAIGRYLIEHAKVAFGEVHTNPTVADAVHVLKWIERAKLTSFNEREAHERLKGRGSLRTMAPFRSALAALVERGYLRAAAAVEPRGPGRPPGPTYDVNPLWEPRSQNPRNRGDAPVDISTGGHPLDEAIPAMLDLRKLVAMYENVTPEPAPPSIANSANPEEVETTSASAATDWDCYGVPV